MHWDGTVTPAAVVSTIMLLFVVIGGLKVWFRIIFVLGK